MLLITPADGAMARFNNPFGVAADSAGNLFVADSGNSLIRNVALVGSNWVVTTIGGGSWYGTNDGVGTLALFNQPTGIAVDGQGNLFVADTTNNRLPKGTPVYLSLTITTPSLLPAGMVGQLYNSTLSA